jgi:hypothetical protein
MIGNDVAKDIIRFGTTSGLSKDVIDLLEKKASLLAQEIVILSSKVIELESKAGGLETENKKLRAQLQNLQPIAGGLKESGGVLWKRTETGFEKSPYCPRCRHVMIGNPPDYPMYWTCSCGQAAPIDASPPI